MCTYHMHIVYVTYSTYLLLKQDMFACIVRCALTYVVFKVLSYHVLAIHL